MKYLVRNFMKLAIPILIVLLSFSWPNWPWLP